MRVLIAVAAIAVLGCSATDLMLLTTTLSSINTSLLVAQNAAQSARLAAAEEAAERRRQERPECCHTRVYDPSQRAWRCTGCDDERTGAVR